MAARRIHRGPRPHGHGHGDQARAVGSHKAGAHRGSHGNPEDLDACLARLEDPARAEWQKPDAVVKALRLRPGQTVCELGAGSGYFAFRLARAVGRQGHVYAVDAEVRMLEQLTARVRDRRVRNITPVLGLDDDPLLPSKALDLVLVVNTYHHFPDGPAFLRRLTRSLRRGGRIVNVDFHRRETPVGPPVKHRVAREEFLRQARRAGLVLVAERDFLPYQYFVTLRPASAAPRGRGRRGTGG